MVMIGVAGGTIIKRKVFIPRIKGVRPLSACCSIAVNSVVVIVVMVSSCVLTMTVLATVGVAGTAAEVAWMMQPTPYLG